NLLTNQELISALQKGGYILYFRHGITDHNTFDTDRENLSNCARQRLLSEEGRQQMHKIGLSIRQLRIKIDVVESSPYCRSIDTAVLAFGRMKINNILRHTVTADEKTALEQAQALRKRLSQVPTPGFNDVLSSHTANLQEAVGIWPKPEGVAVIFKPDGNGSFMYIATVLPALWTELANAYKN
ncbi:MAG: histidine phosphatase family protein, partial [Calditrichaeota bacterium]|nr:histidine phosphatase family protein [Calditrichota bacterium]